MKIKSLFAEFIIIYNENGNSDNIKYLISR